MNPTKKIDARAGDVFLVSLFFSSTLFLLGPAHVYYYNYLEFKYTLDELLLTLSVMTCIAAVAVSGPVLLFINKSSSNFRRTVSVLFAISFLLWLQGNVLLWDYGLLDGADIAWSEMHMYGVVDAGIWALLLGVALIRPSLPYRAARMGSVLFIVIQTVSLMILSSGTPEPSWVKYTEDKSSKFSFSAGKNVVLLVLDTFQTDIFREVVAEDRYYRDLFEGFTYFPDAAGGYPTTIASVPLMMTGRYFDNSVPLQKFIKEAYLSNSVPRVLKERGFHVNLPLKRTIYCDEKIASNFIEEKDYLSLKLRPVASLMDLMLFRHLPHYLKKHAVFDNKSNKPLLIRKTFLNGALGETGKPGEEREEHVDVRFIEDMRSRARIEPLESTFKYYRLNGLHGPFRLNEQLRYEELPEDFSGIKSLAKAELKITGMFLDTLKDLGIYDNTMVLVVADHGSFTVEAPGWLAKNNMAYLNPLVLVKPFDSGGGLEVSDAPVSLADIPRTIFDGLGLEIDAPGVSMLKGDGASKRRRRHYSYLLDWRDKQDKGYLPEMREYYIEGHSWLTGSWRRTHRTFSAGKMLDPDNGYTLGEPVRFSNHRNSIRFLDYGWLVNIGGNSTFSIGKRASLTFDMEPIGSDVILVAELSPYLGGGVYITQKVIVRVNGRAEGKWAIEKKGVYEMRIPAEHIAGARSLNIVFEFPYAYSTFELGIGKRRHPMSVKMENITLRKG
jgi:hypothetical protein